MFEIIKGIRQLQVCWQTVPNYLRQIASDRTNFFDQNTCFLKVQSCKLKKN